MATYTTKDLHKNMNDKLFSRRIPTHKLDNLLYPVPVSTKFTLFPGMEGNQCLENKGINKIYNTTKMFTPSDSIPFSGYQNKVDDESQLKNIIFPIQKCPQNKFIPNSTSDLYNNTVSQNNYKKDASFENLKKREIKYTNNNFNRFNPNTCNMPNRMFNNSTRLHIKNLK
tara:strand:+ start:30 stop:539 length:510 start_codon:yes stop_codon:yes gene_type:complete